MGKSVTIGNTRFTRIGSKAAVLKVEMLSEAVGGAVMSDRIDVPALMIALSEVLDKSIEVREYE